MIFIILAILINIISVTIAQPTFVGYACSNNNYDINSTYSNNLNIVLSSLRFQPEIGHGFYTFSTGENSNKVNALALCRGDISSDACRVCVNDSTYRLVQDCPTQKGAVGWNETCTIRYTDREIFGIRNDAPVFTLANVNQASDVGGFNKALQTLLDNMMNSAASGDSVLKFASGNQSAPNFQTIYGFAQCTPDLSQQDCYICLEDSIGKIPGCCNGSLGARVLKPSCMIQYEMFLYYNATPFLPRASPPVSPLPSANGKKTNTSRNVIITVVSSVIAMVLIACIIVVLRKRRPRRKIDENVDVISSVETLQYDFDCILAATNNFSDANKLGEGGFGAVYKGRLEYGQEIAVKRLSMNSSQGDIEFKNEVLLVAKLQHRNLVRLLGFCFKGNERLLVYEFVRNASLDQFLFDRVKRGLLNWETRYKIIGGIARGLLYLHEDSRLRIIHRDLKASNILLDEEMNPKIADFGMAKLFAIGQTQDETKRIVGTYGYMSPEYAMHGQFSIKSDVFSFGVLILEIICGQKNSSFHVEETAEDLLGYAWKNWRKGTIFNFVDPKLTTGEKNEIMRCIHIGLLCVQGNVTDRPTMASVVHMLNSFSTTIPVPAQPFFFMNLNSGNSESSQSKTKSIQFSSNDISVTEPYPR